MFLIAEVHPFGDANSRIARIMMNAELATAGEVRIIVPTVYRNNYLSALRGATHNSSFSALRAMLAFAWRWTARVNFTDRTQAEADLMRRNATRDSNGADKPTLRLSEAFHDPDLARRSTVERGERFLVGSALMSRVRGLDVHEFDQDSPIELPALKGVGGNTSREEAAAGCFDCRTREHCVCSQLVGVMDFGVLGDPVGLRHIDTS